jgi:hypothetical protein
MPRISSKRQIISFYLRSLEADWMENEQHTLSQALSEIMGHVASSTADPVTVPVLNFQTGLFRQEEDEDGEDNDILPVVDDNLRSTLMNRLEGMYCDDCFSE